MGQKNLIFDLADSLVKIIYKKTLDFPFKFQSSLADQLRRASLSIVLNLVEGGARISLKEKRQFLNIAYSSLKETKYLVNFAYEFKLISEKDFKEIFEKINRLAAILYGILYKK